VATTRKAPKLINAFTARTHLGQLIKQASEGERFVLTKKGRPKVVILGVDDFEDLLELAAEQEDKELQRALRESMRQYKRREVSSLDALQAIYAGAR
jgi:prevent-host-death family protein